MENINFICLFDVCTIVAESTNLEAEELYDAAVSLLSSTVAWGEPGTLTLVRGYRVKHALLELLEREEAGELTAWAETVCEAEISDKCWISMN